MAKGTVVNATQQLVVPQGTAISVAVPIAIFTASPSIRSANDTGSGPGHVYAIDRGGIETQTKAGAPATAPMTATFGNQTVAAGSVGLTPARQERIVARADFEIKDLRFQCRRVTEWPGIRSQFFEDR